MDIEFNEDWLRGIEKPVQVRADASDWKRRGLIE
jgi:hypothetical protein